MASSSSSSSSSAAGAGPINIAELPLPQLQAVKQQMEEDIQHLTSSYAQLKQAQAKFGDSLESLDSISGQASKPILVPLTSSLYVPGELGNVEKVIVDIGTGYFIEKSIPDAKEFYKGKVTFLKENLEQLQQTITQREQQYKILVDLIQTRLAEARAKK
ncbi:Prefoldin-domain-containing protein [Zopfochytrium polystomum]|nr:Prefoldin-domain-containing protein [Zopfochytrium polystomum]